MKKLFAFAFALVSLASCDYTRPTLMGTIKRPFNTKRIIRPMNEGVVYASYIDTAYKAGDTIRVQYTHDETRVAIVIR